MAKKAKKPVANFSSLDMWDWAFLVGVVIALFLQFNVLSELKQVPGPVYGGDLYYHYGHIVHIADGGSVIRSSHYQGEFESYPWLTHFSVAILSWIAPAMTVFKAANVFFPMLLTILSGLVVYLLGEKLFESKPVAFIVSFIWILKGIPSMTPSFTASALMIPAFFLALYYADSFKTRIVAGVVLGLVGLQHLTVFLGAFIAIGLLFISRIVNAHVKFSGDSLKIKNKSKFWNTVKEQVIFFLPMAIVGLAISLLYLWPPLVIYGGETPNPWQEYTAGGLANLSISTLIRTLMASFLMWHTWFISLVSVLAILGIYSAFKLKKAGLPILVLVVTTLGYLHPYITSPLLGTSYGYYRFPIFLDLSRYLFAGFGIYYLYLLVKNSTKNKWIPHAVIGAIFILALVGFGATEDGYRANQWSQIGFTVPESTGALLNIADQIRKQTDVNDVFLSTHPETSFSLTALTGRKVLFMRRTHASPYVDTNKRAADGAVMLYGDNSDFAKELADFYHVKYFYEDFYASQARQQCLGSWENLEANPEASYSCITTSVEHADYLTNNGVEFKQVVARLDPSLVDAPTFPILAIKPEDVTNFEFVPFAQANIGGQPAAVALRIQ